MKIASFTHQGRPSWGILTDHGLIDLGRRTPWPTFRAAMTDIARLADHAHLSPDLALPDITLDIPVPNPEKILCVGVNFPDRNAEYNDGTEAPPYMALFPQLYRRRPAPARPPESEQLDYEGEIAIIIGKPGRRITEAAAYDHIAAVTIANEGTIRDWVRHAKFNVTQGKNWDRSGSIGPFALPFTDAAQLDDIALSTHVNGARRQHDRTARMIFSFRRIVAYISTFTTLMPGDTILCGTPTGAGARHDPPLWLKPGDTVTVTAKGIGTLTNPIADEVP